MSKQKKFIDFMAKHFFDKDGVVYSGLNRYTFGLITEELFEDATPYSELPADKISVWDGYVPGFLRSELWTYENSGMATGATMVATVMEYKRTGSPEALNRAKKLFNGLKTIEDCGRHFYDGFVTKYYGGRFTYQTSNDQCLYHIYGLDAYYEIASDEEKAYIEKQIPSIVRFWVDHNYTYSFFQWENMKWPPLRFPALLAIAWYYSKEELFKSECERILAENVDCIPEFNCIDRYRNRRFTDYEEEKNIRYLHHMADSVTMDIMNLCLLLRVFPDHEYAPIWKKGIKTMWDQGKGVLLPDGKYLTLGFYQMDSGKTVEPYDDCPLPWAKSAWGTMVVCGGLMGLKYMPECRDEVVAAAQNVIDKLEPEDMTYIEDLRAYPDKWKHKERFLSGDAIANYLWSYELLEALKN